MAGVRKGVGWCLGEERDSGSQLTIALMIFSPASIQKHAASQEEGAPIMGAGEKQEGDHSDTDIVVPTASSL